MTSLKSILRRDFIKQFAVSGAAVVVKSALPTVAISSFSRSAKSAVENTLLSSSLETDAVLKLMPKIAGLGAKENGDPFRAEALKITLDQMLVNQEAILRSILDVNTSITELNKTVRYEVKNSQLDALYNSVKSLFDEISTITSSLQKDKNKLKSVDLYKEFAETYKDLRAAASLLEAIFSRAYMKHEGVLLAFNAAESAYLLSKIYQQIGLLEIKFSPAIPRDSLISPSLSLKASLTKFDKAMKSFIEEHMKDANNEQDKVISTIEENIKKSSWHPVSDYLFSKQPNNTLSNIRKGDRKKIRVSFSYIYGVSGGKGSPDCSKNPTMQRNSYRAEPPLIIYPVYRPAQDEPSITNIQIQTTYSYGTAGKFTFDVSTVPLKDSGNVDIILDLQQIGNKENATVKIKKTSECAVRGEFEEPVWTPPGFLAGIPKERQFSAPESKLGKEFKRWQLDLQNHARAKIYKATLNELEPVLVEIVAQNKVIREIVIPDLEGRQRTR